MFSKKMMFVLLSIACLNLSKDSSAMAGRAGRTAARFCGHNIGFSLGSLAVTCALANKDLPDYKTHLTLVLPAEHAALKTKRALFDDPSDKTVTMANVIEDIYTKLEPEQALKTVAPIAMSLGIAMFTRGMIAPVAIGTFSGAGYAAAVDNGLIKNEFGKKVIDEVKVVLKLAAIEEELKKRPDVTSIQTAFATRK